MSHQTMPPFDEPMDVSVHEGEVVVIGPDGINGSFLAEAAEESGRRLIEAARKAAEETDPRPVNED